MARCFQSPTGPSQPAGSLRVRSESLTQEAVHNRLRESTYTIAYVHSYLEHFESSTMSLDPRLHLQHVRIRCLQHTCGTINIIILPCGNIRACARRRQGQRRLERQYPSLPVDRRCQAAAPSRSRHTNSLPGAVIRSHPRCTAAQRGSSVPLRGMKAPTILIECKKKVFRRLSAAKLESANLNTLHKWKGTFAARALIAEPIKEPLLRSPSKSLNC